MSAIRGRSQGQNVDANRTSIPRARPRKELICRFCDKSFSRTEHLLRHERSSHTKERPFKCSSCESDFSRKDIMLRHLLKMHSVVKTHPDARTGLPVASHIVPPDSVVSGRESSMIAALGSDIFPETNMIISRGALQSTAIPSTEMGGSEIPQALPQPSDNNVLWTPINASDDLPWWLEQDLNLEAFDTSLFRSTGFSEPWFEPAGAQIASSQASHTDEGLQESGAFTHSQQNRAQKAWFTHVSENNTKDVDDSIGTARLEGVPATSDEFDLGTSFRSSVSRKLTTLQNTYPLPSTKFLNQSVRTYFTHFASLFPVIHSHTFRPSRENSFLLLITCSIGSLLINAGASSHGIEIFERFNKALLATWDTTLLSNPKEAVSLIQAAFLGQIFGLLSGDPRHLAIVEALHGTIISWTRRCNLFSHGQQDPDVTDLFGTRLEEAWLTWAKSESILRIVIGLYVLDAHLASVFHHDPLLRHDNIEAPRAADDLIFNAATALEWKSEVLKRQRAILQLHENISTTTAGFTALHRPSEESLDKNSQLMAYLALQSISARVSELQMRDQLHYGSNSFKELHDSLMSWYFKFKSTNDEKGGIGAADPLSLAPLWHATYMNLLTNFDKLERALGREGSGAHSTGKNISYATTWAASTSADRCILHAQVIQQTLSDMRLNADPAIHIPHCAFIAGIACYSAMRFRRPAMRIGFATPCPPVIPRSPSEFPEFNVRGRFTKDHLSSAAPVLFENTIGELFMRTIGEPREAHRVGADIYRQCIDVLLRMGHCGNARKYGATLVAIIDLEVEKWTLGGSIPI